MDDLFFYSAKIAWLVLSPASMFILLLVISWLMLVFNRRQTGLLLLTLVIICALGLSLFRVGDMLLYPLESRFQHNPALPETVDGIIVLGGSVVNDISLEWGQLATNSAHERLSSFVDLARRYSNARLVFTGGNASLVDRRSTEADHVKDYFNSFDLEAPRLLLEDRSRNTAENARFTRQLVRPGATENWLLITTAFHLPRSVGAFCQAGWRVIPYPVDFRTVPGKRYRPGFNPLDNLNNLTDALHEWGGLLAYYATGKIDSLLPGGCHSN